MSRLSEKELRVLGQISRNSAISQRELASATGVSLGLTNIILKKFLKDGYLQVAQLNKRKLKYILTRKGIMAVSNRTFQYVTQTIRDYQRIQEQLGALLNDLQNSGYKYFSIHGKGDIREMIENLVPIIFKDESVELGSDHDDGPQSVVLSIAAEPPDEEINGHVVSVLDKLRAS